MKKNKVFPNFKIKPLGYVAIAVIAILLLLNINLLRYYLEYRRTSTALVNTLGQEEVEKLKVEAEVYKLLDEYNNLKGESQEKDQQIDAQKTEILAQKARIDKLIKDGAAEEIIKAELEKLRRNSRTELQRLKSEIAELQKTNQELVATNSSLKRKVTESDKIITSLNHAVDSSQEMIDAANDKAKTSEAETKKYKEEKEELRANAIANAHLNFAITKITPETKKNKPVKLPKSGEVAFIVDLIPDNGNLIQKGEQFIYLVLNGGGPGGLSVPMGADDCPLANRRGVIENTYKRQIIYDGNTQKLTITWTAPKTFQDGTYELTIFHNGHPSSNKFSFEVKR